MPHRWTREEAGRYARQGGEAAQAKARQRRQQAADTGALADAAAREVLRSDLATLGDPRADSKTVREAKDRIARLCRGRVPSLTWAGRKTAEPLPIEYVRVEEDGP